MYGVESGQADNVSTLCLGSMLLSLSSSSFSQLAVTPVVEAPLHYGAQKKRLGDSFCLYSEEISQPLVAIMPFAEGIFDTLLK